MALPQLGSHNFFFSPYFGNAIATITLPQIFFPPYFGNGIATISLSQFFFPISAIPLPLLVCHKFILTNNN